MPKFKLKDARNGQFFWRYEADNGEVICNSETYVSKQSALHSIDLVKQTANAAPVVDETVRRAVGSYRL